MKSTVKDDGRIRMFSQRNNPYCEKTIFLDDTHTMIVPEKVTIVIFDEEAAMAADHKEKIGNQSVVLSHWTSKETGCWTLIGRRKEGIAPLHIPL